MPRPTSHVPSYFSVIYFGLEVHITYHTFHWMAWSTCSCIQDMIGKSSQQGMDAASKRRKPFVPVVGTAPYGDTHSFVGNECNSRLKRFVVPGAFLHQKPPLFTNPDRNPPSTSNLIDFVKPSQADTAKNQQQAVRQAEQAAAMKVCRCTYKASHSGRIGFVLSGCCLSFVGFYSAWVSATQQLSARDEGGVYCTVLCRICRPYLLEMVGSNFRMTITQRRQETTTHTR